jgi:hypothetical protein
MAATFKKRTRARKTFHAFGTLITMSDPLLANCTISPSVRVKADGITLIAEFYHDRSDIAMDFLFAASLSSATVRSGLPSLTICETPKRPTL